jgi:hypothetical protein
MMIDLLFKNTSLSLNIYLLLHLLYPLRQSILPKTGNAPSHTSEAVSDHMTKLALPLG